MRLGKREQIVGIGIGGLVTIGALHFFVFSGRAAALKTVYEEVEALKPKAAGLRTIDNPTKFNEFKKTTGELKTEYADIVTSMTMREVGVFAAKANPDLVELDQPPPPGTKPNEIRVLKQQKLMQDFLATSDAQVDKLLEQVRKIMSRDRRVNPEAPAKTEFLFIGDGGWQLIPALPQEIYSAGSTDIGRLVDRLSDISQTQGMLKVISSQEQPDLYTRQRNAYENGLKLLGINNDIYRDVSPRSLSAMGEYVPLIHKLAFAMLVEEAMAKDPDREITGQKMSRSRLYEWLEIRVPVRPLQGAIIGELYYVHEELVLVNHLMDLMVEHEIAQVYGVRLGDLSYVSAQPQMANGDIAGKPDAPTREILPSAHVLSNVPESTAKVPPPGPEHTGVAITVTLQFKATNKNTWSFIYDYLAKNRLSELDAVEFRAAPSAEGSDVFCQVRFLHVIRLLNVARQIAGGKAGGPGAAPPPGSD